MLWLTYNTSGVFLNVLTNLNTPCSYFEKIFFRTFRLEMLQSVRFILGMKQSQKIDNFFLKTSDNFQKSRPRICVSFCVKRRKSMLWAQILRKEFSLNEKCNRTMIVLDVFVDLKIFLASNSKKYKLMKK